ncbi:hypothetical protein L207DRAFT_521095, partial [Hyaloscypha variabilis F]
MGVGAAVGRGALLSPLSSLLLCLSQSACSPPLSLALSCPIVQPSFPKPPRPPHYPTWFVPKHRPFLAGWKLPTTHESRQCLPDATSHATVHMHRLRNSSSTQPRSTSSCTCTALHSTLHSPLLPLPSSRCQIARDNYKEAALPRVEPWV